MQNSVIKGLFKKRPYRSVTGKLVCVHGKSHNPRNLYNIMSMQNHQIYSASI